MINVLKVHLMRNKYKSLLDMSISVVVCGFQNLGNTCYMNSVLQAILTSNVMNTAFIIYLQKHKNTLKFFSPMLIEYLRIIIDLLNFKSNVYRPIAFKETLDSVNDWFKGHSQHDSNEFLLYLINEFIESKKPNAIEKSEKSEKLEKPEESGISKLIKRLCFGKFKQYICCDECRNITVNYSSFLDVALPIPETKNPDLDDCFKKFAKYEMLDDKNKCMCDICKKKVIVYKKMEIHDVPEVTIFTLNRFKGNNKNVTPVRIYPIIELEGKKLKLISTVNHYGSVNAGHYVAHISRGDVWYKADDTSISRTNINNILNDSSVYMVVYQVVC